MSPEEKASLESDLMAVYRVGKKSAEVQDLFKNEKFYKVPWKQAVDLFRGRQVLLRAGFAYVPEDKITAIAENRFSVYLKLALLAASKNVYALSEGDERLKPILNKMAKAYAGPDFGAKKGVVGDIRPENIDDLSSQAFALCMSTMHNSLRMTGEMKHEGRQQYGLFLKGIGLSMEDALIFWQKSFSKKTSPEEFLKKYAYNIRHNYGKEGKRSDYTPFSCIRVIMNADDDPNKVHGCPFKRSSEPELRKLMGRQQIDMGKIENIMEKVNGKHYQIACRMHFEARFPLADSGPVGNHPNAYFEQAMAYLKKQKETAAAEIVASKGGAQVAPGAPVAPVAPEAATRPAGPIPA